MIFTVCAWCGKAISAFDDGKPAERTSHGLCEGCRPGVEEEVRVAVGGRNPCEHGTPPGDFCTFCEAQNTGLRSKA